MTLPKIGKPATRALNSQGIYTLEAVSQYTKSSLMEMHGVGPKAI
ncbi:DNA-binding protein, partial [Staphylococcus aureus]|nr:DNA-binding protein [Staphylococcus aureus]